MKVLEGVGIQGFRCPKNGSEQRFKYCLAKCPSPCLPPIILASLAKESHFVEGHYRTTEILAPPQQTHLMRTRAVFVDPFSQAWLTLGTATHEVIESGVKTLLKYGVDISQYEIEQGFREEIQTSAGLAVFTGTPDIYWRPHQKLYDVKTAAVYLTVKARKRDWSDDTYVMQTNIYKVYKFPDTREISLVAFLKDWKRKDAAKTMPVAEIPVPIHREQFIRDMVGRALLYLLEIEQGTTPRQCTHEECWPERNWKTGQETGLLIRCAEYCAVAPYCLQYKQYLESGGKRIF